MAAPKDTDKFDSIKKLSVSVDSPRDKKTLKRQRNEQSTDESDEMFKFINQYQENKKKTKVNFSTEYAEMRDKILEFDNQKQQEWKKLSDSIFKNISEIKSQVEADYNSMKEIEQTLKNLTAACMKSIKEATAAFEHKLRAFHDLNKIKKQYEDKAPEGKEAIVQFINELNSHIQNLSHNINKEAKRKSLDSMHTLLQKLQEEE